MFIPNKYLTIYFKIVNRSKNRTINGPVEEHHIIPKCLGGSNKKENLATLTPKEHFICHKLLIKITEGEIRRKMCYALWRMCHNSNKHNRNVNGQQYEYARKMFINSRKGYNHTKEAREKMSNTSKGIPRPWAKKSIEKHHEMVRAGQKINHSVKRWRVTDPQGIVHIIDNLTAFCKEKNLSPGNFTAYGKTKGYSAVCLGIVKDLELID